MNRFFVKLLLLTSLICFFSCNAFMYGYTSNKALDSYYLITGDKNNFGDKRLTYNKGFHNNSALSNFLDCKCNYRGLPDFIYEYKTETKCAGIKLYYAKMDSVFIFEEPKKNNLSSIQKDARKMDDYERQTFERLKMKNN